MVGLFSFLIFNNDYNGGNMGKFRIYSDKGNTLIENSQINTGKNEVAELWYGSDGIARYFVHFDFSDYNAKYLLNEVPHITAATATLNMTACYPVFERYPYDDAYPAEASQIDVKVIQQFWDAGIGHDFYGVNRIFGKSNWYSATSTTHWALPGGDFVYLVFSGMVESPSENLVCEVTNEVELWNNFTGNNYGFVIKFNDDVEDLSGSSKHILKYYTNHAWNLYKKPYIELSWDDQIRDERDEVCLGTNRSLYLYLKKNGVFTDAYGVSGVTIEYSNSATPTVITSINNPARGIYQIDFNYPLSGSTGITFTDKWAVKYESGMTYTFVSQTGVTRQATDLWEATDSIDPLKYDIQIPNMLDHYTRGDRVYLQVNFRTPYTSTRSILKDAEYKLTLVDGTELIDFTDWEPMSYSQTENFIILDTTWLHPTYQYMLSVRYTVDGSLASETVNKKFWIREE